MGKTAESMEGVIRMENLLFHLIVIPGIFLLGRLSGSVRIAVFRAKNSSLRGKSRLSSRIRP